MKSLPLATVRRMKAAQNPFGFALSRGYPTLSFEKKNEAPDLGLEGVKNNRGLKSPRDTIITMRNSWQR